MKPEFKRIYLNRFVVETYVIGSFVNTVYIESTDEGIFKVTEVMDEVLHNTEIIERIKLSDYSTYNRKLISGKEMLIKYLKESLYENQLTNKEFEESLSIIDKLNDDQINKTLLYSTNHNLDLVLDYLKLF